MTVPSKQRIVAAARALVDVKKKFSELTVSELDALSDVFDTLVEASPQIVEAFIVGMHEEMHALPQGITMDTDLFKHGVFDGVGIRVRYALINARLTTLRSFLNRKGKLLKSVNNFGLVSLDEVRESLRKVGIDPDKYPCLRS